MKEKKNSGKGAVFLKILIGAVLVLLLVLLAYRGGRWLETRNEKPAPRGDSSQRLEYDSMINYGGKKYRLRKDITTVLVMGIDTESEEIETGEGEYRNGGQADFQRLIVADHGNKRIIQIAIDRDTMTDITVLGVLGNSAGTREAQICLAHSFGGGGDDSCTLACDAVSELFLGIPVDLYCAVNLDGISEINDFVGGITVTLQDDFTSLDPEMTAGRTLTLHGRQAEYYSRSRLGIGIGTNESRMVRQQDYIEKLLERIKELYKEDSSFAERFYDSLTPHMTTNIARGRLVNELSSAQGYDDSTVIGIDGEHMVGTDGFMQFIADKDCIRDIVLDIFYEEV